jgi:hypothetical protein
VENERLGYKLQQVGHECSGFMTPASRLGLKTEARLIVRPRSREHTEAYWLGPELMSKGGRRR